MGAEPWGRIMLLRSEGWWDGREPMSRDQGCDPSWATAGASWCILQSRREEGRTRTHSHSTWAALLLPWARIWPTPNTCRAKRDSHTPRKKKKSKNCSGLPAKHVVCSGGRYAGAMQGTFFCLKADKEMGLVVGWGRWLWQTKAQGAPFCQLWSI